MDFQTEQVEAENYESLGPVAHALLVRGYKESRPMSFVLLKDNSQLPTTGQLYFCRRKPWEYAQAIWQQRRIVPEGMATQISRHVRRQTGG